MEKYVRYVTEAFFSIRFRINWVRVTFDSMFNQLENSPPLYTDLVNRAEAQRDTKEAPSMSAIASVLNIAFSHLNHLKINYKDRLNESFVIEVDKKSKAVQMIDRLRNLFTFKTKGGQSATKTQAFPRRMFHTAKKDTREAKFTEQDR